MTGKTTPINDIRMVDRFRKDFGDLDYLASSIDRLGLLQPIGITSDNQLVFGERRLRACRDILGWTEIPCRILDLGSLLQAEHDENEVRKAFTVSERVAIFNAIEKKPCGDQSRSQNIATVDQAAKKAGFGNRETARQARKVVETGTPELVTAMDEGRLSVSMAKQVAELPPERQIEISAATLEEVHRRASVLLDARRQAEVEGVEYHEWYLKNRKWMLQLNDGLEAWATIPVDPAAYGQDVDPLRKQVFDAHIEKAYANMTACITAWRKRHVTLIEHSPQDT